MVCCKSARWLDERARAWRACCLWALLCLGAVLGQGAQAGDGERAERATLTLEHGGDGVYLSARMPLALSPSLEDALLKGVPLHFVWQAEIDKSRWYWMDARVATVTRVVRLAYQPLTRRWRLSVSAAPLGPAGQVNALHQNVDSLEEGLATVSRVSHWRLADAQALEPDASYHVNLSFQLDTGLLPRPFQIGLGRPMDGGATFRQELTLPARGRSVELVLNGPAVPSGLLE